MNVFGIGTGELLLILVIVLLVMGPERLPQLARQWGKFVRVLSRFTRTWQEISAEINRQITLEEMANASPKRKPVPTPPVPTSEEPSNTIAPPYMQPPAPHHPDGEVEALTPASGGAVESMPSDRDLTSTADPLPPPTETLHE